MSLISAREQCVTRDRAFTLVELLLSLALCSIVGLLAATMLAGLVSGTNTQNDIRRAGVNRQVAIVRLGSLSRGAAMALVADAEHLVLWKGDSNGDSQPNLSELRRIEWDADCQEIRTFESPTNLDPANDQTYELTADFSALTAAVGGSAVFPARVTLQNVSQWSLQLDSASPQSARLIRLQLTIDNESGADTATIISALRAAEEGSVQS